MLLNTRRFVTPTDLPIVPFVNAEEAWFWFIRCQSLRDSGAQLDSSRASITRPCDPDGLYCIVKGLRKNKKLHLNHLQVLVEFGRRETPPDPRNWEESWSSRLWDEALDRLTTPLKQKGIVLCETE